MGKLVSSAFWIPDFSGMTGLLRLFLDRAVKFAVRHSAPSTPADPSGDQQASYPP